MCYSDNSTNYYQQSIQISIGCIGILSFIAHFIAFILWTTYILGWRTIIKWKSIQRKRQLNYNFMTTNPSCTILQTMTKVTTTTTTATTAVNTLIHRNDINTSEQIQSMITPKKILIWPNCSLRISIQIIILSMEFINIIGCCTDLTRLIYLSMTSNDLRLLTNDWLCRIQIFLSFISCDISGWHFVCLCIERCYIILFPRNYYSINRTSIKPALIMILFIYFIAKTNDHWIDNLFNLLSILYWFVLTITSYVLMLGTITVRHDIKTILLIIWYKIWKRNSFIH
ncbi:unnamed protein product [Schistosoma intercalatum]|nr:unnamed protein product [Schistosoma intercalatum]